MQQTSLLDLRKPLLIFSAQNPQGPHPQSLGDEQNILP